jgi:hypothetical protein
MGLIRWTMMLLCTLALALAAPLAAHAQEDHGWSGLEDPIAPDRPDFTDGTATIAPGHVQVEGGGTYSRTGHDRETDLGELLVRIGVGERLEVQLAPGSYVRIDSDFPFGGDSSGFEDSGVGIKLRLVDETEGRPAKPAIALLVGTSIPIGSDELTSDNWVPGAKLAFDWDLTPTFSLSANVGGSRESGDFGERFNQLFASLSAGFGLSDRLGAYLEVYALSKDEPLGSSRRFVDTGLSYLILHDVAVDARIGYGLDGEDPNWSTGIGASVRW